jgi:hypothetical protein
MPVLLIPAIAGVLGFAVGSWTSGLISSLFKMGLLAAAVYAFFKLGVG